MTTTSPSASFSNINLPSSSSSPSSTGSAATSTGISIAGSGHSPVSVSGLVSGINSSAIINALVAANAASTDVIQGEETNDQTTLNALGGFNTLMLTAQLDLNALEQPSTFQNWQATSSNSSALSATSAGGSAVPGTYTVSVTQVAQADQIATAGQSSESASLGDGTVKLQLGSGPVTTLDFSSGGSLSDIAAEINNANVGIMASVIDNGSGSSPYQLVLQSAQTGEANTVLVQGTGGLASVFSGMTTLTNAQNAEISIGGTQSGTSAITLNQASNTFTNLVPGISLTATAPANNISVTVASSPTTAQAAINKFVKDFNSAVAYFDQESAYNSSTQTGGPLISYSDLRANLDSITEAFTGAVPTLPSSMNNLNELGITIDSSSGTLTVDDTTLQTALTENPSGVMDMFVNGGTSTNTDVQYANLTDQTNLSNPFTVDITTAAQQAVITASGSIASSGVAISSGNDVFNLTVNGTQLGITLTNGTYTPSQLATQLQTSINAAVPDAGDDLNVSLSGGKLTLQSTYYGSNQTLSIQSSSLNSALGLSSSAHAAGVDVAGTIDGVAGTGDGQLLTGADNTAAAGLTLSVTATAPVSGVTVTAYQGLAQQADALFTQVTDSSDGSLATEENALSTTITDLGDQITQAQTLLSAERTSLENEFTQMEDAIASYQQQGSFLTQQIDDWDGTGSSSS